MSFFTCHQKCHTPKDGDHVDQAVQLSPTPPQPPLRLRRGRERQGNQQQQSEHADRDVRPLDDVLPESAKLAALIEQQVHREMQQHVEECEQAEHAPEAQPEHRVRQVLERRHAQGDHQEIEGPAAAGVQHDLDRVGAERDAADVQDSGGIQCAYAQVQGREQARRKHERLQHPAYLPHQKYFRRSIPL